MIAVEAPVRVLIADDQTLFRAGLARILARDPRLEVVAQAKNGSEAVEETLALRPDVVLMDLRMPGLNGVEAVKRLHQEAPSVRVLVLSAYADRSMVTEAIDSGAVGYADKDITPDEMVQRILSASSTSQRQRPAPADLSKREVGVLKEVASGLSNKQIARRLGISEKTVRNHLSHIYAKLNISDRAQLMLWAIKKGLAKAE